MGKKKLLHFAENESFENMFQPPFDELQKGFHLQGKWNSNFFKNNHPIVLELGCGKGEYTVGLAKRYPEKNFIGIDVKGARLWRGCKTSIEDEMSNVAFIRSKVQLIEFLFAENEVDEIWITFPDPQPRQARENRRLSSPKFLNRYKKILKKDGIIHLKTDNEEFFHYTLETIKTHNHRLLDSVSDLYNHDGYDEVIAIKTHYEKIFTEKGFRIHYLKFQL